MRNVVHNPAAHAARLASFFFLSIKDTPVPSIAKPRRPCALIGAGVGAAFAFLLGLAAAIDNGVSDPSIVNYFLAPMIVGGFTGLILGWSFGTIWRGHGAFFPSLVAWVLLSAFSAVLLPALAAFLYGWATGIGASGFPLRGTGPSVTPFGLKAAMNSFGHVALYVVFFGLPVAAVGAIAGGIVALVRFANRRNQWQDESNERD